MCSKRWGPSEKLSRLNPIEQVWRTLYAEVLHLHRWAEQWVVLPTAVQTWLDRWREPSTTLLHQCGLLCSVNLELFINRRLLSLTRRAILPRAIFSPGFVCPLPGCTRGR